MGGDLTGKLIIPFVENDDGTFNVRYLGKDLILKNKEECEDLERKVRYSGFYPYYTNPNEC